MASRLATRSAAVATNLVLDKENAASGQESKMAVNGDNAEKAMLGCQLTRPARRAPLACLSNKIVKPKGDGKASLKSRLPKVVPRQQQRQQVLVEPVEVKPEAEPMELEEAATTATAAATTDTITTTAATTMELEEAVDAVLVCASSATYGVRDIDAEDLWNPQLCGEYAKEMYVYLRRLEADAPVRVNYLTGCHLTGRMRSVLIDWLVDVQQQFKLLQETLFLSVSIIDRYLQADGKNVHRTMLQLVGVAAMFIAAKYEEIYAPEIDDFVYITDNAYTAGELRAMEGRILRCLNFSLGKPIAINFLRRFSKAGDVDVVHHTLAKYILEGTLLDYSLVWMPPSMAAAVSLYLALVIIEQDDTIWEEPLEFYSGYTRQDVLNKMSVVIESFRRVMFGKLAAVRTKYASSTMMRISEMPGLKEKLDLL